MKKNIYVTDKVPAAKNGLTSRANYVQRKKYDFNFYKFVANDINNNYIDIREYLTDFCKIDSNNNSINLSESRLKNIENDVYVVDFVADAFNELKILCENSEELKEDKFKILKPKKGWSSLHNKYHEHLNIIFKEYIKQIEKTHKDKNIDSFEKFIFSYIKFLDNVIYKTPFLKSSYLRSNNYPITETGFVIEFEIGKNDDDSKKFKEYFNTYQFTHFAKLCKKTNFLIDKNCPWRIVYDTFSDLSEEYMKKYNINRNTLIENYFYKAEDFDLINLKQYMIIMYNTFVNLKPTAHNVKIVTYNDKQILSRNFIDRLPITNEVVDAKFNDRFWFNIYCHLFFVENSLDLKQSQYEKILKSLDKTFLLNGYKLAKEELKNVLLNTPTIATRGEYNFVLPSTT